MANIKIAQLTNQTTISDTDVVIVETATSTNKMTVASLKAALGIEEGGIEESGSNVNGKYVKYKDGTMICYSNIVSVEGAGTYTLPATFINTNYIVNAQYRGQSSSTTGSFYVVETFINNTSSIRMKALAVSTAVIDYAVGGTVMIMAIGRWK